MAAAIPDFSAPVQGPAYSAPVRALASGVFVLIGALAARAWFQLPADIAMGSAWVLPTAGMIVLATSYYLMLRSVTILDAEGIRQTGLLEKRVTWSQVDAAHLSGFAGSRRLVVRSGFARAKVFFGGTPELLAAFERVAAAYPRGGTRRRERAMPPDRP